MHSHEGVSLSQGFLTSVALAPSTQWSVPTCSMNNEQDMWNLLDDVGQMSHLVKSYQMRPVECLLPDSALPGGGMAALRIWGWWGAWGDFLSCSVGLSTPRFLPDFLVAHLCSVMADLWPCFSSLTHGVPYFPGPAPSSWFSGPDGHSPSWHWASVGRTSLSWHGLGDSHPPATSIRSSCFPHKKITHCQFWWVLSWVGRMM